MVLFDYMGIAEYTFGPNTQLRYEYDKWTFALWGLVFQAINNLRTTNYNILPYDIPELATMLMK